MSFGKLNGRLGGDCKRGVVAQLVLLESLNRLYLLDALLILSTVSSIEL